MKAVGIDVDKGKTTIAIINSDGDIILKSTDFYHTKAEVESLIQQNKHLEGKSRVVMKCTGKYHEPLLRTFSLAGLFVSPINPKLINSYEEPTLRNVKYDKANAKKVSCFTIER